ncbi:MAG: Rpn family recombination-promoting nuclease/putative transposase [Lachnospiraceae bacterium]|nr:Rpn family recombination-promoting nuclease/putative transposase [Lachnospiraceae bacterium]
MGKTEDTRDIVEKEFVSYPDITADIINVLLYRGKKVTKAQKLLSGPTESFYQGGVRLRNQYEDLCKYEMTEGKIKVAYLIANQSRTDGKMLLRKAGYTGGMYREQYEKKAPNIFPVIEFILYWGRSRWRRSLNCHKLFREQKLSGEMWEYIDEMELHVFEMRYLPEKTRELFQSDMRIVADYLAEGNSYRSNRKIVHKAALIRMIRVLSGDLDIEDVEKWMKEQKIREEDEITVCELFDQYVRQGEKRGMQEGIEKGENRLAKLIQMLMDGGRSEDVRKALSDQGFREQLYMEAKI